MTVDWVTAGALLVAVVAIAPLALLAIYVIADRLGVAASERLLDPLLHLITAQWAVAAAINIGGGVALMALGVWAMARSEVQPAIFALGIIGFGAWRGWIGVSLARAFWTGN